MSTKDPCSTATFATYFLQIQKLFYKTTFPLTGSGRVCVCVCVRERDEDKGELSNLQCY